MKDSIGQNIEIGDDVVYSASSYGAPHRRLVLGKIESFGKHAGKDIAIVGTDQFGDPIRKQMQSIAKVSL
jgi:Fe2+ transport system protein FeoA